MQNGYCERPIGSIRRGCLDDVVGFDENHLPSSTAFHARRTSAEFTCRWPNIRRFGAQAVRGRIAVGPILRGISAILPGFPISLPLTDIKAIPGRN